jgi:hypothetical protein
MPIRQKDSKHGYSVSDFERERRSLTDFLKTRILPLLDADECHRILICAPVKSGKREMIEYLAVRDQASSPRRVHAFVSAFHRVADENQRKELRIHNMEVFSLVSKSSADHACEWITAQIAAGKHVVLHIDECDFGAGDKQILSRVYKKFRVSPKVTYILYSATPQEVLFSGEVEEDVADILDDIFSTGERVDYIPPDNFRGPARFLDSKLVIDAKPFFYKAGEALALSEQGKSVVSALRDACTARTGRNICVLRLSYCDLGGTRTQRKENKAIYQFLQKWQTISELDGFLVITDKGEKDLPEFVESQKISWSSRGYWDLLTDSRPILIVVDQTSSRSTEWKCHNRVNATHDYRNTIIFSTVSQAQERVNHYIDSYDGSFQPIRVYGHKKSFLLSAGRISYSDYMHLEWEMRKVDRRVAEGDVELYQIRSTSRDHTSHPTYPAPLPKDEADRALQELGCYCDVNVSARVRGTVRKVRIYDAVFHPCTKETFPTVRLLLQAQVGHEFQDPFERSETQGLEGGRYKGYLREWRVMDYDRDVHPDRSWGVADGPRLTVCYRGDQIGVAFRYDTGRTEVVNTLETRKSMYAPSHAVDSNV